MEWILQTRTELSSSGYYRSSFPMGELPNYSRSLRSCFGSRQEGWVDTQNPNTQFASFLIPAERVYVGVYLISSGLSGSNSQYGLV